ncbi:MAG: NAD-dependent protein deacylase [Clostridia bacterium]|nr:NAD-dependent protein deacylase [Clostridia bacterium]
MDNGKIQRFAELIKNSNSAVFFGGAGVSTESGMKDYRSRDGLYNTVKKYKVSPETILSHSFFESHPDVFYDFYHNYFLNTSAQPNRAHIALAQLEKNGKLKAVITQNIDGLHQRAGSVNVIELHGTTLRHYCPYCKTEMSNEKIKELYGGVPKCEKCGHTVRPDVVLYEEQLNEQVIESAINAISSADLLIIGGTSLAVYPAAGFLHYFGGENIVLINRDETPFDKLASLVFRDSIGDVLSETVKRL